MKIISALLFFLVCYLNIQPVLAQDKPDQAQKS